MHYSINVTPTEKLGKGPESCGAEKGFACHIFLGQV